MYVHVICVYDSVWVCVLWMESRALHTLGKYSIDELYPQTLISLFLIWYCEVPVFEVIYSMFGIESNMEIFIYFWFCLLSKTIVFFNRINICDFQFNMFYVLSITELLQYFLNTWYVFVLGTIRLLSTVIYALNPSPWLAEASVSLWIWGQPGVHGEF